MMGWQWHQPDHMQIICTSLQTDNRDEFGVKLIMRQKRVWCTAGSADHLGELTGNVRRMFFMPLGPGPLYMGTTPLTHNTWRKGRAKQLAD